MSLNQLVIFVKAPRPGLAKTRLARSIGANEACAAYRTLMETLLRNVEKMPGVELRFTPDDAAPEIQGWLRKGWKSQPQGPGDLGVCGGVRGRSKSSRPHWFGLPCDHKGGHSHGLVKVERA